MSKLSRTAIVSCFTIAILGSTCFVAGCGDVGRRVILKGQWDVQAAPLDFGTIALTQSAARSITVRNAGNAALSGTASVSCPAFHLGSPGPFTIAPGGALTLPLTFSPGTTGVFTCTLSLGPGAPQVGLSGTAALQNPGAQCTVSAGSLDFGSLAVGQNVFRIFKVHSTGTAPLIINIVPSCSSFSLLIGGGPAVIAAGDSLTAMAAFNPASGGVQSCTIAVGPGCPDVAVSGLGTTVSYSRDVQRIFDANGCSGCHGWQYQYLVNYSTYGYAPAVLIKPFDPAHSVVYNKITNTGVYGSFMPPNGSRVPLSDQDLILTWILEGATNN